MRNHHDTNPKRQFELTVLLNLPPHVRPTVGETVEVLGRPVLVLEVEEGRGPRGRAFLCEARPAGAPS